MADCLASVGIESLAGESGTFLDCIAQIHDAGEGVCEVQTEKSSDKVGEGAEFGHGHGDDEGDDPVEWAQSPPQPFALSCGDWRGVEEFLTNLDVYGLHANVEVEDCNLLDMDRVVEVIILTDSEPTGDQGKYVTHHLETEWLDSLGDGSVAVLAVVGVGLKWLVPV